MLRESTTNGFFRQVMKATIGENFPLDIHSIAASMIADELLGSWTRLKLRLAWFGSFCSQFAMQVFRLIAQVYTVYPLLQRLTL
jgi:hypothetical protein